MKLEEYVVDLNADCACGCMEGGRFHKIFKFPNGYGASVVSNPKRKEFAENGFTILPMRFRNDTEFSVISSPMIGIETLCNNWDDTVVSLEKIKNL